MREFGQRVRLVHELRELAAAEELLHGRHHGTDVDERAGRGLRRIGDGHALAHDALHAHEADAELLLDELAHGAHAAVAEVVDVVRAAAPGVHVDELARQLHQVEGAQPALLNAGVEAEALVQLVPPHASQVVAARVEEELVHERAGVLVRGRVARADLAVELEQGVVLVLAGVVGAPALAAAQRGLQVGGVLGQVHALEEGEHALVRAQHLLALAAGGVARALGGGGTLALQPRLGGVVLGEGGIVGVAGQQAGLVDDADEHGHGQLALAVDLDAEDALRRGLEFEPGPAAGDELGAGQALAALGVRLGRVVDAGGAHQLAHDHALGAVHDEGAAVGHQGEVTEEEALLLDLARILDAQLHVHEEGRGVGLVALAALVLVVLGLAELVLAEDEVHLRAGEVLDGRDLVEQIAQPLAPEPVERIELQLDQAGDFEDVRDGAERLDGDRRAITRPRTVERRGHALAAPSGTGGRIVMARRGGVGKTGVLRKAQHATGQNRGSARHGQARAERSR